MSPESRIRIRGTVSPLTLMGGVILAVMTAIGSALISSLPDHTDFGLTAEKSAYAPEERITVTVSVDADTPVNVFSGQLNFDPSALTVDAIEYNTSIADLWVELPWYANGAGTVNFGGGTTVSGGFVGSGMLITVHFRSLRPGETELSLSRARILRHDGLGTDVPLTEPFDTLITVVPPAVEVNPREKQVPLTVVVPPDTFDLNHDGAHTIADTSMFMYYFSHQDLRGDFTRDGRVNIGDLSLFLTRP